MTADATRQTLADHIEHEAIALNVEATTSEAIIRLLADRLARLGHVRPSFAEAVLAREAQMPTGLPMERDANVAVPHTDPEHVIRPGIAIATLARPVDFANMESPDEHLPVGIVFMLALNDKDRQIEMLQQIMETIQDDDLVDALLAARTNDQMLALLGRGGSKAGE
ncbi:PTS sugar transporter subunit IIA [Manganibacter manganicus]|uniref:PTS sugar transporter subunit IIA n=1 Tax=Manganibacter manganicus TaxID=1873176 RepID=A0A1V8RMJ1_9HYPH|nr:PTS sugar transporter subunit IIA [Pseudaminobacter manganicus]OQM74421.1 PTS sugar transporter subunit IIA [Pseudaminobacter manganicus]